MRLARIFARRIGVRIYGLGAVVLGIEGLFWRDFAVVWQPVPSGVPGRPYWAYAVAAGFLLAGLAIQWRRAAVPGTVALSALYGLGAIFLHLPHVLASPTVFVTWEDTAEPLALAAAGLVAIACSVRVDTASTVRVARIGCLIFGGCLIVFGLAHLFYLALTASMVPAWLPPGGIFWAYATAGGHFAAGIAILSGFAARLGAVLLTAMFVIFAILVHAPTVLHDPHAHFNWSENAINFALIGAAWVIAAWLPGGKARV